MANQYIGVDGVGRKVKSEYIGVDGVARKITHGYVGVSGVAREFYGKRFVWNKYAVAYTPIYETRYSTQRVNGEGNVNLGTSKRKVYLWNSLPTPTGPYFTGYNRTVNFNKTGNWYGGVAGLTANPNIVYGEPHDPASYESGVESVLLNYARYYTIVSEQIQTGTSQSKGQFMGTVESDNPNQYPANGIVGGYWYEKHAS